MAPRFPKCPPIVTQVFGSARYCLAVEDARTFLHWQQEQQSGAQTAVERVMGLYREELARRQAAEGMAKPSLGLILGVAGGILGTLATGLVIGYLWGHFEHANAVEVPRATQSGLERLGAVPLLQP